MCFMASKVNPEVRNNELVIQELKGELLIYDLQTNKAFCLNEISALTWNLSDGTRTVSEISNQLSKKLKKTVTEDLVWLALNDLKEAGLLSNGETVTPKFDGLSRREAIRRVGLASMIAIPVISSLVAPTAAEAQSGGGTTANCAACTQNSNCASGNCAPNPFGGNICSAGSSTGQAYPPGTSIGVAGAVDCAVSGNASCCNGSATFTPGVGTCICN
jgi:hypothetical protein